MAAAELRADLDGAGGDLSALEGLEYSAEFFDPTDKLGADKPNPKSHVAYGFATHVVILDDDGRVKEVYAAHDSGKVVNPTSIQGQIEGGVLMGLGYALTEDFPLKDCVPQAKFGTLGLMRADQIPDIHAIYVEKEELLPFAYGAKGIGEIATIPTAPAAQGAYYPCPHPAHLPAHAGHLLQKASQEGRPLTFRGVPAAGRPGSRFPVFPLYFRRIFMDAKNFLVLHHFF